MATFEVFVPVQGEVIYTIEADNAADAEDIVSTMDWSDGGLNLSEDNGTRVELIDGEPNYGADAYPDDDTRQDDYAGAFGARNHDDVEFLPVTTHAETGKPYAMRHFRL